MEEAPNSGEEIAANEELTKKRLQELSERYKKLLDFAKDQEFAIVFRGEGSREVESGMEQMGAHGLTGTWYAESYNRAKDYLELAKRKGDKNTRMLALIIPKSILLQREPYERATGEVNIVNPELIPTEIDQQEDAPDPALENYINQFTFVREYNDLKKQEE